MDAVVVSAAHTRGRPAAHWGGCGRSISGRDSRRL